MTQRWRQHLSGLHALLEKAYDTLVVLQQPNAGELSGITQWKILVV